MAINVLEITTSITVQSLGNIFKATMVSFTRQILLFIPIACLLSLVFDKGIYGVLYAGPIADFICFIICIFIFGSEYKKLTEQNNISVEEEKQEKENNHYHGKHIVITISREYGSGGRYVGKLLAEKLGVSFYDKELISLSAKESGLSKEYIEKIDEKNTTMKTESNNDDRLFIAETKIIKDLAKKYSCVIVGRCADYILKDNKDTVKVFLYSDEKSKEKRVVKYYNINKDKAPKFIKDTNKKRSKHYKYYTGRDWYNFENYDILMNVDELGIEKTVEVLENYIKNRGE